MADMNRALRASDLRISDSYKRKDGGTSSIILGLYTNDDGVRMVYARYRATRNFYWVEANTFCAEHERI